MKYRFAESKDRQVIQQLVSDYVQEARDAGCTLHHTTSNVQGYMTLFDSYRRGSLFGVAVLAEHEGEVVGLTLCGETWDPTKDTDLGRIAYIWMMYVAPPYRKAKCALEMLRFGEPALVEDGFQSAVTNVRVDNPAGARLAESFGARPLETVYMFSFGK